jgi:hypothetical protein
MTRLSWAWYRWTNPLRCHGTVNGGPCPFIATGPFKPWAMRWHQKRVHGG